ncbi:hypothetical protein BDBG_07614, partial [Blastomyces gilchristii SLH14081]
MNRKSRFLRNELRHPVPSYGWLTKSLLVAEPGLGHLCTCNVQFIPGARTQREKGLRCSKAPGSKIPAHNGKSFARLHGICGGGIQGGGGYMVYTAYICVHHTGDCFFSFFSFF